MSVFRPSNINRRLVGTASTESTGSCAGSPGNAGQIGPIKTPYCLKGTCDSVLPLGCRFFNGGGSCSGVFKTNESRCGRKELCNCTVCDCKGFFICCGPSTTKYFVAPSCTEITRDWFCRGDACIVACNCMGNCGWFVPSCGQLQNPGFCCRTKWDSYKLERYWSNTAGVHISGAINLDMSNGTLQDRGGHPYRGQLLKVRAFRCTPT